MNNFFYNTSIDIDEATSGIEISLSAIQLATSEIEAYKKLVSNGDFFNEAVNVLYLGMERIQEEQERLQAISKTIFAEGKKTVTEANE